MGDLDEALEFYGRLFDLELRGRVPGMVFVDLGDQFLALAEGRRQPPDEGRHFGLVVDDREAARQALQDAGIPAGRPGGHLEFHDPWGNCVEVVAYADVQFAKRVEVLRAMGLDGLGKSEAGMAELRERGFA